MNLVKIAAISGAVAVILGAFGAHSLKGALPPEQLQVYETGVRYQFYHTLAILLCGLLLRQSESGLFKTSGYFFLAGIVCFSGSLYLLSTRAILGIEDWAFLGPVTPVGGLFFICGWIILFAGANKSKV
jgi:uncharacterized membrane protein YgdD (TMEM256/DUF423 family)